ncbi:MAG: pilus assembly PilX family protein [Burkholderiaceae bacterium]
MKQQRGSLPGKREEGIVLILVLIGIVAMALAGIALVRATQTTNMIAGNFAFKQAALASTDVGVELAFAQLDTIILTPDTSYPSGCAAGACVYYPTRQAIDVNGIPTVVGNWSAVPATTVNTSYSVQHVIDRLCNVTSPDPQVNCYAGRTAGEGGSKSVNSVDGPDPSRQTINYRVRLRVSGPRNTTSFVQAIVAK